MANPAPLPSWHLKSMVAVECSGKQAGKMLVNLPKKGPSKSLNRFFPFFCVSRSVMNMKWLAEATYTGQALQVTLNDVVKLMKTKEVRAVVLTDGRSDITRDNVPLNVLCNSGVKVGSGERTVPGAFVWRPWPSSPEPSCLYPGRWRG